MYIYTCAQIHTKMYILTYMYILCTYTFLHVNMYVHRDIYNINICMKGLEDCHDASLGFNCGALHIVCRRATSEMYCPSGSKSIACEMSL